MLLKYTEKGNNPNKILKLFRKIGELKGADYKTLSSVKNDDWNRAGTKTNFGKYLGDKLLKLGDSGIYQLTPKGLKELENSQNYPRTEKFSTRHIVRSPEDSWGEHRQAICAKLLPMMYEKNYHATFYTSLYKHNLEPDACIVYKHSNGYQLFFLEIETEDHGSQYLLKKRDNYISAGQDVDTWGDWWQHWSKVLDLPFCEKEQFCFSVICQGKKTFDQEGWEWV